MIRLKFVIATPLILFQGNSISKKNNSFASGGMHFNEENLRPDRRYVISSDQVLIELNYLVIGVKVRPSNYVIWELKNRDKSNVWTPTWMIQKTHTVWVILDDSL